MDLLQKFFQELYKNFNDRKIDLVIANMTEDVKWTNRMEGGYVCGHNGVSEYWVRIFTMMSSKLTPLEIHTENDLVKVKAHQVVHDLEGKLLADEIVYHLFHLQNNKIALFEVEVTKTNEH